ncbi:MAG: thioredoxin family protein [Bacillus sp. (in: firmicutes)]
MKKIIIFLVVVVALFASIAIINNTQNSKKVEGNPFGKDELNSATIAQLDDENYQNIILPEELDQLIKNKEDAVVYFYSPLCEHCKNATPKVMEEAEKLGIEVLQYNLLEFEQGWDDYGIQSTPTLAVIENGKLKETPEGTAALLSNPKVGDDTNENFKKFFKLYIQ